MSRKFKAVLLKGFDKTIEFEGHTIEFDIPKGFCWDLCSGPFVKDMNPPVASCIHDWLYITHACPRKVADKLYERLLVVSGACSPKRAKLRYVGLRMFGWAPWKTKENVEDFVLNIIPVEYYWHDSIYSCTLDKQDIKINYFKTEFSKEIGDINDSLSK